MRLSIYSPKKVLYEGEVASLNCKTTSGEITILDHHRPLISILARGTIKILDKNEKEGYIPISSGFIEVRADNRAQLIVEE